MTASEVEDDEPGRRSYHDPRKARLSLVQDLKPSQWAAMLRAVARAADRGNWPVERTAETLEMLGINKNTAKDAREALRRSKRARELLAANPLPTPTTALLPRQGRRLVEARVPVHGPGRRDTQGKFLPADICKKGLHAMTPENRITRWDRTSTQCRACTIAREVARGKTGDWAR